MAQTDYLAAVHAALPRILALFDNNPISATQGIGDRYRWAWKGSDFANGTFQGAVHGLACLVAHDLLPPHLSSSAILQRINVIISATRAITRSNGSLDEILPFESSFCVTALVAFDILSALTLLGDRIEADRRSEHLETVRPLIGFISHSYESHGIITNHLAVGAAALALWQKATGEDMTASLDKLLFVILAHRSPEGWFREYEGADPGYQTLALDYLVVLDEAAPHFQLRPLLEQTTEFLTYMAHPDGSFGGIYGSRNTRFLYPAGIEALTHSSPAATSLAAFARQAHETHSVVGLAAMDEPNLIPMFNSFCRASALAKPLVNTPALPCSKAPFTQSFPEAGLIITRTENDYSIINWKKGGAFYAASLGSSGGALARNTKGAWFTTQTAGAAARLIAQDTESITIEAPMLRYRMSYPSPFDTIVLRLLCLTFMRSPLLNGLIKRLLVWLLITRKASSASLCRRYIRLRPFAVQDTWVKNGTKLTFARLHTFQAIHMASQGYWQYGDDA